TIAVRQLARREKERLAWAVEDGLHELPAMGIQALLGLREARLDLGAWRHGGASVTNGNPCAGGIVAADDGRVNHVLRVISGAWRQDVTKVQPLPLPVAAAAGGPGRHSQARCGLPWRS